MAKEEKSFFDRLGDALNAPLPGTAATSSKPKDEEGESILGKIMDALNQPLPGTGGSTAEASDTGFDPVERAAAPASPSSIPGFEPIPRDIRKSDYDDLDNHDYDDDLDDDDE